MKTILCFGDSNTWGAIPGEHHRYSHQERWPALLRGLLPDDWHIIEEGQPGRTTVFDDPFEGNKNGLKYLRPCLESHHPDLVVIMLGTNDLKHRFGLSASDISRGAARLVKEVYQFIPLCTNKHPEVLLVAPPVVKEVGHHKDMFLGAEKKSKELAECYALRADELNCNFFNAGSVVESCPTEGVHWQAMQHKKMAETISVKILSILK